MGFHRHRWITAGELRTTVIHKFKKRKTAKADPMKTYRFAVDKAKSLTDNPTEAELVLKTRLDEVGVKHYFQMPFSAKRRCAIIDFAFSRKNKTMLFVEIDGGYHLTEKQREKDQSRSVWLVEHSGADIIRFTNDEIINSTDKAISKILANL